MKRRVAKKSLTKLYKWRYKSLRKKSKNALVNAFAYEFGGAIAGVSRDILRQCLNPPESKKWAEKVARLEHFFKGERDFSPAHGE